MPIMHVNGTTIACTDTGPPPGDLDAPTVVFGHGLLFGGWMFRPQVEALRTRYRCVTVDWRGQGDSPPTASGYDMDTLTDDALAVIGELGVAPVHYVGLSMGGFVGQRIAARHGEVLRSLTLLGTSAAEEAPDHVREYKLLALVYRLAGLTPVRSKVLPLMFGPTFRAAPGSAPVIAEWTDRLRRCHRAGIRKAVLGVADRPPVLPELHRVTTPTLVVVGADDAATPPAEADLIAATIPGARHEILADCGHSSTLEQPAALNALLLDFLTSVDGPRG